MNQPFFLLDGAQGLIIIPIFFLAHMISTILIEGSVLYYFKIKSFGKCLLDTFIVNLCSLVVGLLFLSSFQELANRVDERNPGSHIYVLLGLFWVQTVLVEGFVLWMLNRKTPFRRLAWANIIMNILSYIVLYFILGVFDDF